MKLGQGCNVPSSLEAVPLRTWRENVAQQFTIAVIFNDDIIIIIVIIISSFL